MPDEVNLPKRVWRVIEHCRHGQTLCRSLAPDGGEPRFWLDPSNRNVGPRSAQEAIASGLLTPGRDCLFHDDNDQTWSARHG